MHAIILAAFAVLYLGEELGAPLAPSLQPLAAASLTACTLAVVATLWGLTALQLRGLNRDGQVRRVRRVERAASMGRLTLFAAHATAVLVLGWLEQVRLVIGDLIALDELVALLPFIVGLAAIELVVYPIEARLRHAVLLRALDEGRPVHPFPTRFRFVWLWMRHHVLFMLIPLAILLAWTETAPRLIPASVIGQTAQNVWLVALQAGGVAVVFALIPPLLVRTWDTVPLGPGPLLDDLARMCRQHRVPIRRFLVWRTSGLMLNGAAIGIIRPLRYVVLTDGLLDNLSEREVEAVAAHEIGHMRHRHILWLALSVLAAVLVLGTLSGWAVMWLESVELVRTGAMSDRVAMGGAIVMTLGGTLAVLGMVSRRFERQADAFAARHLSGEDRANGPVKVSPEAAHDMAHALQRVAIAHDMDPDRPTFRHGSIRGRQRALAAAVGRMTDALPADKAARRARLWVLVLLIAGVALATADVFLQTLPGR